MRRRRFSAGLLGLGAVALARPALAQGNGDSRAKLVEAAKREGGLSYWDTVIQPETNDALAEGFRKAYGLPSSFQVNYTLSNTGNLVTRVEQEIAAQRATIDIASIASPTWVFEKVEGGHVLEYHSPEYEHYGRVFEANLGQKGYFAFNGAYMFVPMWNGDTQDFKVASWRDVPGLLKPGRFSLGDATISASYLATFMGLRKVLGDDYFREMAKLKPNFLVRSEQIASRLVTNQDMFAVFGQPTRALQNNERGASLKFVHPKEGVVLMPQCSFILKQAPHPNAAKLWIDYILSPEAQAILAKREAMSSGRTGFQSPVPDYAPNIEGMKLVDLDWRALSTEDMQKAREDWRKIFSG
ncbi:MAG TPA: extracellular solute-binding protein [Roseomonas sp.]|nr:extracellular solute-binding protein [Roseomonas sp.]